MGARDGARVVGRSLRRPAAPAESERRRLLSAARRARRPAVSRGHARFSHRALVPRGLGDAAPDARRGRLSRRGMDRRRQLRLLRRRGLRDLLLRVPAGRRAPAVVVVGARASGERPGPPAGPDRARLRLDAPRRRRVLGRDRRALGRALDSARDAARGASRPGPAARHRASPRGSPRAAAGRGDRSRRAGDAARRHGYPAARGVSVLDPARAAARARGPVSVRPGLVDGSLPRLGRGSVPEVLREPVRRPDRGLRPPEPVPRVAARHALRAGPHGDLPGARTRGESGSARVGGVDLSHSPPLPREAHARRGARALGRRRHRGRPAEAAGRDTGSARPAPWRSRSRRSRPGSFRRRLARSFRPPSARPRRRGSSQDGSCPVRSRTRGCCGPPPRSRSSSSRSRTGHASAPRSRS